MTEPIWNVYPNYRIPIDYIYPSNLRERIGWVITPSLEQLKNDMGNNIELVGEGILYSNYKGDEG